MSFDRERLLLFLLSREKCFIREFNPRLTSCAARQMKKKFLFLIMMRSTRGKVSARDFHL
jgi:hypothetical protein